MNDDILCFAAKIGEWADRITYQLNKYLAQENDTTKNRLRSLIKEYSEKHVDMSLDCQRCVLAGNGWIEKTIDGLYGWIDPDTNEHYFPKDAIFLQVLRDRKRDTEPHAY